jgi:hypothetical protein
MVSAVLLFHKDEMQARSEMSTVPHFVRRNNVTFVTKNLFLRGHHGRMLRDRQLGYFTFEEEIEKHNNRLIKVPSTFRLHKVFHINNIKPCFTTSLRHVVRVTTPKGDENKFNVSHTFA